MDGLDQTRPSSSLYLPLAQLTASSLGEWQSFPMILVIRTANDPSAVVSAATNTVHELNSDIPVRDVLTMNEVMANSVGQQRFNMLLLGLFGVLALFLAAIGIYSVLSYSVRRRVQEIGIRLALGAKLGDVLRMVVLEGMKPVVFGVALGAFRVLGRGEPEEDDAAETALDRLHDPVVVVHLLAAEADHQQAGDLAS